MESVKMSWDNLLWVGTIAIKQGLYYRARKCMPHCMSIKKAFFSGCYSHPAKEIENGKNVSQFMSKCLGTTLSSILDKMEWWSGKRKTILDPFFNVNTFLRFFEPPTHYVSIIKYYSVESHQKLHTIFWTPHLSK